MKVTDLDIFSSKNYLELHRINRTATLESGIFDLTKVGVEELTVFCFNFLHNLAYLILYVFYYNNVIKLV